MARRKTEDTNETNVDTDTGANVEDTGLPGQVDRDDSDDRRTFVHPDARRVQEGELSAAQITGGHGNVDPANPDAQYPQGIVDNNAPLPGVENPAELVPERRVRTDANAGAGTENTSETAPEDTSEPGGNTGIGGGIGVRL